MVCLLQVMEFLCELAPPSLAEDWDNVGLLVGDSSVHVSSVLTCLTLTPNVAEEAIARQAQLVVSHHPVLFRPVQRLTTETDEGRLLLKLIQAGVAVYCPHTSYDSAENGINQQLARLFDLQGIQPLRPMTNTATTTTSESASGSIGSGRWGLLPQPLSLREVIEQTKMLLRLDQLQYVGNLDRSITRLGIACGSAAEFLRDAVRFGCEALLTGEARFHSCLEAQSADIALVLPGHYATERPAMESLADRLRQRFPQLNVQASKREFDPVQYA